MRFLTWLLGVFVVLLALELSRAVAPGWTAVWVTAAVVWFFAGAGLGVSWLLQLVSGKVGAGGVAGFPRPRSAPPAPHKEE